MFEDFIITDNIGQIIDFKEIKLPDGAINCEIKDPEFVQVHTQEPITISARIKSSDHIIQLLMLTDALRTLGALSINLDLPYMPHARWDRHMKDKQGKITGDAFGLLVIAKLINAQNYSKVTVFDPHSEVTKKLITNIEVKTNTNFVKWCVSSQYDEASQDYDFYLISPDKGAKSKCIELAKNIGYKHEVVLCEKVREAGKITVSKVNFEDFQGRDCVIVDDICDGGATFIGLANELKKKNCGKITLIVSHGIFSKGFDVFNNYIDEIYTTDSFNDIKDTQLVRVAKIFNKTKNKVKV